MKRTIKAKTNGVSTIKGKTKISVNHKKGDDDALSPDEAERLFCGRRLDVTMEQNDEQIMLEGFEPGKLQAICEVKSFSSKPGSYTAAFVFNEDEVAIDQLKEFQFTDIKIQAELVGEADPDDEDEDTDDLFDEDEGEDGDEG